MSPVSIMAAAYCEAANWADGATIDSDFEGHAFKTCSDLFVAFSALCLGFDNDTLEQCGHDLWLTRQRHGTGFWDRRDDVYGAQTWALTNYAENLGEFYDFVSESRERGEA